MSTPFISVVIPTYNAAKFLREALDSLLAQTFTDWEAICVNDGSTDGSLSILQEYAAKDTRFRILDAPNGGYGKAMNRGLDAAEGEYLAILEPDDFTPRHAYKALAAAARQYNADVVRGEACYFFEGNGYERTYYSHQQNHTYYRLFAPREETILLSKSPHTWTCLYRLSFLRKSGIRYHETPGASYQDTGMFFLSAAFADHYICIPDITYAYRTDNPSSSVHNISRKGNVILEEFSYIRQKLESGNRWTPSLRSRFLSQYLTVALWMFEELADDLKLPFLQRLVTDLTDLSSVGYDALTPGQRHEMKLILQGADAYAAERRKRAQSNSYKLKRHGLTYLSENNGHRTSILLCGIPVYRRILVPKVARHFFFGLPLIKRIAQPVYDNYGNDFRYINANRQVFYVLGIPLYSRITEAKEFLF